MDAGRNHDQRFMRIALAMGRRGLGTTAPNPAVGAVLVDEASGEVISRGWTQPGGRPHAETEAIRRAGPRARGATLYSTLEPCSHHGKTPPCADAIIAAGIRRVVGAILDPHDRVAGQGFDRMRAAGIEVVTGVLGEEAWWLAAGHILRTTERRPVVEVKIALDEEGFVPRGYGGKPVIVTSGESLRRAHMMRARADAILVGMGTVRDDNPELTCRLPGLAGRSPLRVVVGSNLEGFGETRIAASAADVPVLVLAGPESSHDARRGLQAFGIDVEVVPAVRGGRIAPRAILAALAGRGITRLLVEGGEAIWQAFFAERLADRVTVFLAKGASRPRRFEPNLLTKFPDTGWLEPERYADVGPDRMMIFRRRGAAAPGTTA